MYLLSLQKSNDRIELVKYLEFHLVCEIIAMVGCDSRRAFGDMAPLAIAILVCAVIPGITTEDVTGTIFA